MDFQQGLITTIHEYGKTKDPLDLLLDGLRQRPTALLIPCLFEEFRRPAFTLIREVLSKLKGLENLVIALSAQSIEEVEQSRSFFSEMPFPVHIQWTNGPAVLELLKGQEKKGLELSGTPGKGWAVWQGLGVATSCAEVIGLFDGDIRTFNISYPARMLQPLVDPSNEISYVKAFYSRLSLDNNSLQGRATRLFVGPILTSLEQLLGSSPFLRYLKAFRYPLAGEFAFTRDLAMNLRIPCDWGLEIGLLSEVYRHVPSTRIAQVDLGIFDHKHKAIGSKPNEGLQRMCSEILATILRGLMEHQAEALSITQLSTLEVLYRRVGEDRVKQFGLDSAVNQLPYNRHQEEICVQKFSALLRPSIEKFYKAPITEPLPSWSRLLSFQPRFQEDLSLAGSSNIS